MSASDYTKVRKLKLHEILSNEANKQLVRQYATNYCDGFIRENLLKLAK